MGIEFVVLQNKSKFSQFQVLPVVYNQEAYKGKNDIYIVSSEGIRYKVALHTPIYGLWFLAGKKWTEFCNRSLHEDVELLHFIEEGDDTFYVTGYFRNGKEVGGYDGNVCTYSRFRTKVLPYPHLPMTIPAEFLPELDELDEITIEANGNDYNFHVRHIQRNHINAYQLLGNTWNNLVDEMGLEAGTACVLTKDRNNRLWFDAFNDDGSMITPPFFKGAVTLNRRQPKLDYFEEQDNRMKHICFWRYHTDHFDENRAFYKSYAHIECKNRLAITADFLKDHPMHMYNRALIIHGEFRDIMTVRMEPHKEAPYRTNHVNVHGQWKALAVACRFPYKKMIRFKYMGNGEDLDAPEGINPTFPVFHIC